MAWFKTDDKFPRHRKARAVRRSHPTKRRDAAPFGLWVLAGAESDDGFIALEVLLEWDDDAEELAERLVAAGFWHPAIQDGEVGYEFHDWTDHNPADPSSSGSFGNHVRWHKSRGKTDPECVHCNPVPSGRYRGDHRGDIAGDIGGESLPSRPVPTRPDPKKPSADKSAPPAEPSLDEQQPDRFDEFWDAYGKKVKRADAAKKWAKAIKKADPETIIEAARAYVAWERANNEGGRFIADPSTWLHGERWNDERPAATATVHHLPHVSELEQPPSGLSPQEYHEWELAQIAKRRRQ